MATELIGIGGEGKQLALTVYDKRLLSRFRAKVVFMKYGLQRGIPAHGGKAIDFRRMEAIYAAGNAGPAAAGSAPTALTEGTYPAEIQATWSNVQATVSQYGQYLKYSEVLDKQGLDNFTAEATDNFSEAMKDALDLLTRDVLVAGTNVQYASTAASRGGLGSGMYLSLAELREAKRTLMAANVGPVEDGKYVVITNPYALYDLEGDSNITNIWQYAGAQGMSNQLFDTAMKDLPMGFRLVLTTNTRVFVDAGVSTADVVATLMLGEQSYGVIKYDALPARIIRHEPGTSGIADPLDQIGTLGWKASHAAVIVNQNNLVRIEHVTSQNNMG